MVVLGAGAVVVGAAVVVSAAVPVVIVTPLTVTAFVGLPCEPGEPNVLICAATARPAASVRPRIEYLYGLVPRALSILAPFSLTMTKNWDPVVFGPPFAMATSPAV